MSSQRNVRTSRAIYAALALVVGMLALAVFGEGRRPARWLTPPVAAAPNDCTAGNVPTTISVDTTLSGDLFMTGNATVNSGRDAHADGGHARDDVRRLRPTPERRIAPRRGHCGQPHHHRG